MPHKPQGRPLALPASDGEGLESFYRQLSTSEVTVKDVLQARFKSQPETLGAEAEGHQGPEADATHILPRIDSALPSMHFDDYEEELSKDGKTTRAFVSAAIASIVFVAGLALILVHPWNPDAYTQRAQQPADVSKAGFPGVLQSLAGQDAPARSAKTGLSADEATYKILHKVYVQYGTLAKRLDENQKLFQDIAFSGTQEERGQGAEQARSLSFKISNTLAELDHVDTSSDTYAEARENLVKLGNWLRNRSDALNKAWNLSINSKDLSADASRIKAPIAGDGSGVSANSNKQLFDLHYEEWAPKAPAAKSPSNKS